MLMLVKILDKTLLDFVSFNKVIDELVLTTQNRELVKGECLEEIINKAKILEEEKRIKSRIKKRGLSSFLDIVESEESVVVCNKSMPVGLPLPFATLVKVP